MKQIHNFLLDFINLSEIILKPPATPLIPEWLIEKVKNADQQLLMIITFTTLMKTVKTQVKNLCT